MKTHFIALAAISLDGRIASLKKGGSAWTSREDKDFLHRELDRCDLIIVGRKTYDLAKKPLAKRNCLVFTTRVKGFKKINGRLAYYHPHLTSPLKGEEFPSLEGRGKGRVKKVCVLGGSQVYSWFLKRGLIDEIYLTIEPLVFGAGVPLFDIPLKTLQTYKLESIKRLNKTGTIVIHYVKVNYS